MIQSIIDNKPAWPTFADAKRIVALVDACMASHASRQWEKCQELSLDHQQREPAGRYVGCPLSSTTAGTMPEGLND